MIHIDESEMSVIGSGSTVLKELTIVIWKISEEFEIGDSLEIVDNIREVLMRMKLIESGMSKKDVMEIMG